MVSFNGYQFSLMELADFVASFHSDHVRVYSDTDNLMLAPLPEHWIALPSEWAKSIHVKAFNWLLARKAA